ncbi:hypothetical protein PLESTB_001502700 [Pleodorina starrii]|uniref:thiamine diphosphokinase n=1 Tax=Pleodorina starrii TaxID=330485 RepID=A0A9W6F8H6_9CHLO|nr:hypothetical protein PLESTM_000663000 [Pleodorina starrii]GLC59581.1 hypothetical protein PLESTB_001502700 [Pleodorina starrii]GLC67819.1 hypothetical protein PLESTF_000610800 [Pleodorina starrii]
MLTNPSFSVVRKCCSTRLVHFKPGEHWTRTDLRIPLFLTLNNSPRRQTGLVHSAGTLAGDPAPAHRTFSVPASTSACHSTGLSMTSGNPAAAGAVGATPIHGPVSSDQRAPAASTPAAGTGLLGPPYDQYITSDFLGPGLLPADRKIYLIVLNYCLPAGLLHLWPLASFRICADGGGNRLHDELPAMMPPPPEEIAALEALAERDVAAAGAPSGEAAAVSREAAASGLDSNAPAGASGAGGASGTSNGHSTSTTTTTTTPHDRDRDPHDRDPHGGNGFGLPHSSPHYHYLSAAAGIAGLGPDLASSLRLAYLPDVVLGDLDSLRPDVRQYYVQHGVPFMDMSYDQDTNDLTKAISLIEERFIRPDPDPNPDRHQILVLGALGGRLDHTLANLNVLHMFPRLNVTLWGDGNLVRLVRPGRALIRPDERFEGPTCGLIPIAGPVTATSAGLKWNVAATQLRVGGLVSSSNLLTGSPIQVACDGPLLWSTEVRQEPRPDLRELWARTVAAAAAGRKREAQALAESEAAGAVDAGDGVAAVGTAAAEIPVEAGVGNAAPV